MDPKQKAQKQLSPEQTLPQSIPPETISFPGKEECCLGGDTPEKSDHDNMWFSYFVLDKIIPPQGCEWGKFYPKY